MTWAPDYCTVDQLRRYLRLPTSGDVGEAEEDTDNDAVYGPAITAASRAIDKACGRQFGSTTAAARYYTAEWSQERGRYIAWVDDFMTVTSLVVTTDLGDDETYETTIASTDFRKFPLNAAADGLPWTMLEFQTTVGTTPGAVGITAVWGWTAVPDTILNATLLQASRVAKRRDAPFGVAGSPDMGNELRLLSKLDPDVAVMVSSYRRYF